MGYKVVQTDDGIELRNDNGKTIYGPSESYSWPPDEGMADAVFEEEGIDPQLQNVLKVVCGLIDIETETE